MKGTEPIGNEIKDKNGVPIKYNDMKLSYNYGNEEEPIIQDVYVDLGPVKVSGIKTKFEEKPTKEGGTYQKETSSMMFIFDLDDAENKDDVRSSIACMERIHKSGCRLVGQHKAKLKLYDFDPERPGGMFRPPLYWHRDEQTGEIIKGKNPSLWTYLRTYKNNRTMFVDLNGNPVSWDLVRDSDVTLLPCIYIEKIFVGSKITFKIFLQSAVILDIVRTGSTTRQVSKLDKYKQKYSNSVDKVEAQLNDLRMTRQDVVNETPLPSSHTEFGSDYATDSPTMHSIPADNHKDSENSEAANIQDFLSAAPSMSTTQLNMPQLPAQNISNQNSTPVAPQTRLKIN
jgi:hypothetical protein